MKNQMNEKKGITLIALVITIIGADAFYGCTKIKGDLIFPPKITSLNYESFVSCVGIERLIIPDSVTTINNSVFYGCSGIKYLKIPISLAITRNMTFSGVQNVEEVYFKYSNSGV